MRYWWVNQNQTYKNEVPGGFLWSPKSRRDGGRNKFYENMKEIAVGDVVFSFCDTYIKAIGVATDRAQSSPRPDFGSRGESWANEGWLVFVEFFELSSPIRPKNHIDQIRDFLPSKYSPLQHSGDGLQSVYLAEIPSEMANILIKLIGNEFSITTKNLKEEILNIAANNESEQTIKGRIDIGTTEKEQLIKARRGQGIFKVNVRLNEKGCRVTGVTDLSLLIASHIKPWKDCTDNEKLDGCNGLLLAPHVDHLFDKGLISFSNEGELLVSNRLCKSVLTQWGIPENINVGSFKPGQTTFLAYHRSTIFKFDK